MRIRLQQRFHLTSVVKVIELELPPMANEITQQKAAGAKLGPSVNMVPVIEVTRYTGILDQ